ncbi:MAG TPA: aminotransferase class I/II-fold pyridoxal phosphate-dependent enzyme, partial [Blastocatellia bacterium]|nr:aminotransferase class I/II-fold pyridoxal phosphate-dependent enzyme [Blastocatellia bacterium]
IPAEPGDVQVVNGGMHALSCAFQATLDPGDDVILFSPYWTPMRDVAKLAGANMVLVSTQTARRDGIRETLIRHVTPRTKAIYFNTPLNPTGEVFSREEVQAVADFAQDYNIVVISDEAYEDLIFEGEHVSIASLPGMHERTLSCFTFSKTYSMTGWRVGYVVGKEPFMTGIRAFALYSINGVSTPTQYAAEAALTQTPPQYLADLRRTYRELRDLMADGLASLGFECPRPAGAFYLFPNATAFGNDSWQICNMLIERTGVTSVPGVVFGPEGEGHLRLSFSTSRENIEGALDSLRRNL